MSKVTVFSDGSTFDYENGYKSNGAVATRDRTVPKIVKTGAILSPNELLALILSVLAALITATLILVGLAIFQQNRNDYAVADGINSTGQAQVIDKVRHEGGQATVLLRNAQDNSIYKCDVSIVNESSPTGLVFCIPGQQATFSVPVPHDPDNVFYKNKAQDH